MDSRIRAPFNQQHLIEALVCPHDPEAAGICLGLSMEWLAACHARPTQSAHECTSVVGDIDQARRALVMQRAYMDEFASEPALRRPVNRAFCTVGIGIDPYRRFTCHPSVEPVIDVAERVASHISRHGPYHLLTFSTGDAGHGIACIQQANGSFCVFDPNRGSFDVERELLGELLASLVAYFARTQARVDSPSDGNDCSEIVDVAPNNLRSICVSPVHFTEPARGPS